MNGYVTRVHRRAAIIHPIAAAVLATIVATMATLPRPDWPYPAGAIATATPGPLAVTLAVLVTAAVGALIVIGGRRQEVGR